MADEGIKVTWTGDTIVGAAPKHGETRKAGDSLTAASAFMSSPIVAKALRSQNGRDEFMSGIKMQKESALRRGDAKMMAFFGHIMDAVQEIHSVEDNSSTDTGKNIFIA